MGSSTLLDGSVSADVGCKSCLCSPTCEESCVKREKHTFSDIGEKSITTNPPEELEISSSSEEDSEHLIDQELRISFSDVLHVYDNLEPLCVGNLGSDQEENSNHHKAQPLLLVNSILDDSSKCTTVLYSSVVQSSILDSVEEFSCGTVNNDNISIAETPASAYPLAKKPISAMKGSREKQGKNLTTKLDVKWAPEVYDPPITSSSHTVKGHHRHHHHKTKKDYNTHKYTKGKSSRGSVNERKHTHRRSSSSSSSLMDPQISRPQAPGSSSRQVRNSVGQSKMEPPEHAIVRSPDKIIHGSSCYLESLNPIPLPVAKGPPNAQVELQNLIKLFCSAAV